MRRKDREITGFDEMLDVLQRASCVRIAISDGDCPYIVPLSFGLCREGEMLSLYFHCAGAGRKLDLLRKSPRVCFEADGGFELITGESACAWSCHFESVIGEGVVHILSSNEEKRRGLNAIMQHYSGKSGWDYPDAMLSQTTVLRLDVSSMSGKRR